MSRITTLYRVKGFEVGEPVEVRLPGEIIEVHDNGTIAIEVGSLFYATIYYKGQVIEPIEGEPPCTPKKK